MTKQRSTAPDGTVLENQAERVLRKFGGARRLAAILKMLGRERDPATIYKWTYPRSKRGTGGLVPSSAWGDVLAAMRFEGLQLLPEDMDPRPLPAKIRRDEE